MPFYTSLMPQPGDSPATRTQKLRVSTKLREIRDHLADHFIAAGSTGDRSKSVRIATWNLREFGGPKYNGRDFEPLYYIAEIISQFDIVALQEVRANLTEFFSLKRILGPDWDYLTSDVTNGDPGNGERMVFLFNHRRVQFSNLAGEITLPEEGKIRAAFGERFKLQGDLRLRLPGNRPSLSGTYPARVAKRTKLAADLEIPVPAGATVELPDGAHLVVTKNTRVTSPSRGHAHVTINGPSVAGESYRLRLPNGSFDDSLRQFARTPFLIGFQAGWLKINLCTAHIYYGDDSPEKMEQRRSEIELLAAALAGKAKKEFKYDSNAFLGLLGDFNIIGAGHPTMQALESNGFVIPPELKTLPGTNVARDKAYDQIAFWKPSRDRGYVNLNVLAAGIFDFFEHIYSFSDEAAYRAESPDNGLKSSTSFKTWRTYKMSDHLPMWTELRTDFGDEYLEAIETT